VSPLLTVSCSCPQSLGLANHLGWQWRARSGRAPASRGSISRPSAVGSTSMLYVRVWAPSCRSGCSCRISLRKCRAPPTSVRSGVARRAANCRHRAAICPMAPLLSRGIRPSGVAPAAGRTPGVARIRPGASGSLVMSVTLVHSKPYAHPATPERGALMRLADPPLPLERWAATPCVAQALLLALQQRIRGLEARLGRTLPWCDRSTPHQNGPVRRLPGP
jgi:hypothetical protein